MNCYKSSNNKFFNSASRMSDGRNFTDYADNNLFASAFIMSFSALSTYTLSVTEPLLDFGT